MFNRISKILMPPSFRGDDDKTYDARFLNAVLWMAVSFSSIAMITRIIIQDFFQLSSLLINAFQLILWITLLLLLRMGKVGMTGNLFTLGIMLTINLQAYISGGLHRPIIYANIIGLGLATLFSNRRVVLFAMLSIGSVALMYILDGVLLPVPETPLPLPSVFIAYVLITLFTAFILQFAANNLHNALLRARADEQELIIKNQELQAYQQSLETQVGERTNELSLRSKELELANENNQRRATQFEALAQVAKAITAVRDLQELMPRITTVISEKFGFYHVGIFLLDEIYRFAILSAANSAGGKRMLERKHRLRIGEEGIVGFAAAAGKPRIAMDVGTDAVFFNNPDLPDTHSEMALPLISKNIIVGVLDVQSTAVGAFSNEDVQMLSLLADQVSLAIENARIFDDSLKTLAESEMISRRATHEAWHRLPEEQKLLGYRYNVAGATPLKEPIKLRKPVPGKNNGQQTETAEAVVPIALRGEVIGTLVVQSPSKSQWSEDQLDLIRAVAERVALSAENARLFEETTARAEREKMVSDITSKIRSHTDPQSMIQTAIDELRSALGASRVEIVPQAVKGAERHEA